MIITKQFGEIKAISDRKVQGMGVRFGTPETKDSYGEWFYDGTELGIKNGDTRPFLMEHGHKSEFGLNILGFAVYEKSVDGWAYEVKIEDSVLGEKAYGEISRKRYKSSSGSAWHTTSSTKVDDSWRMEKWFLVEQSVTQTPADFYNPPVTIRSLIQEGGDITSILFKLHQEILNLKNEELAVLKGILDKLSPTSEVVAKGVDLPPETLEQIEQLTIKIERL